MKKALVTAIGSFASDIVIKTLKEEGIYVIGCDIYPKEWVAQSLDTDGFYQAPYAADKEEYIAFIKKVCRENGVSFLLPLTDAEVDVLNGSREELERELPDTALCLSGKETIALCRNKERLEKFVRENGICRTIPSLVFADVKDDLEGKIPWEKTVLKPVDGRSSSGLFRVYEKEKLPVYAGLIDENARYLVQPLIEGTVITVDVVRDEKGNCAAGPRKEHLRTLNGAGTSVEVFRDESLEEICREIADRLDIKGCVNFEFIEETSTGKRYFMECNPRFAGGAAFSCAAGCNVVKKHIQVFRDGEMEAGNEAVPCYIARKYQEYRM